MNRSLLPQTNHPMVFGFGPLSAEIVLVGEAPGADEVITKIPFTGAAGKFNDSLLRQVGIERSKCYITNVVKIRPPNNKIELLSQYGVSIEDYYPYLYHELSHLINAKVIVALGGTALKALTGLDKVQKRRGSVYQTQWGYVVPTLHPSFVMQYAYKMHPAVLHDYQRARSIARDGWNPEPFVEHTKPTMLEIMEYLQRCRKAKYTAWDFETFGEQVACVGFSADPNSAMCIPFKKGYNNYWSEADERAIWDAIIDVWMCPNVIKVTHYGTQFDHEFVKRICGRQPVAPNMDTMLAHSFIHADLPHGLDFLTSVYTGIPYYKDDAKDESGKNFNIESTSLGYFEALWSYNCKDCVTTYRSAVEMIGEMERLGTYQTFTGYVQPLYEVLFHMQNKGVPVDPEVFKYYQDGYTQYCDDLQADVDRAVGHPLNVNSPAQMKKFLYKELGLPEQYNVDKRTGRQKLTADEGAIEKLLKKGRMIEAAKRHCLNLALELRQAKKLLGTYLNDYIVDTDGRVRTTYGTTDTGRLSSKGRLDDSGMNLQNVPPELRCLFRAPDGWEMLNADLAQAEARVVAWLANCKPLMDEFNRKGGDVFKLIGSWIFGKPFNKITKDERQMCKRVVHGSHYGMGINLFAASLGLSKAEAQDVQGKYFKAFPEIRRWQEQVRQKICKDRKLSTPFGRVRKFLGPFPTQDRGHDTYKEALAFVPQSTVGDMLNQILVKTYYVLKQMGAVPLLQVHDSVLIMYPKKMRKSVIEVITKEASRPVIINGRPLVIPMDIAVGPSWGEMEKI